MHPCVNSVGLRRERIREFVPHYKRPSPITSRLCYTSRPHPALILACQCEMFAHGLVALAALPIGPKSFAPPIFE